MTVSCGIVLLNERDELFLVHSTLGTHWDLPKGKREHWESAREAALREAFEETSLDLSTAPLEDLGRFRYVPKKNLHLFLTRTSSQLVSPANCHCRSYFFHRGQAQWLQEVDDFGWFSPSQAVQRLNSAMSEVLREALSGRIVIPECEPLEDSTPEPIPRRLPVDGRDHQRSMPLSGIPFHEPDRSSALSGKVTNSVTVDS